MDCGYDTMIVKEKVNYTRTQPKPSLDDKIEVNSSKSLIPCVQVQQVHPGHVRGRYLQDKCDQVAYFYFQDLLTCQLNESMLTACRIQFTLKSS